MAATSVTYTGDGSNKDFNVTFGYTSRSFVKVYVNGAITGAWSWLDADTIRMTSAPTAGATVLITRVTSTTPLIDFVSAATLTESDLDTAIGQCLDLLEENQNNSVVGMQISAGAWDATSKRIANVSTPTAANDAANKTYVDGIAGSAVAAAASASAAALSAADALTQAGTATTQATNAGNSASAAAASAASISSSIPISGLAVNEVPVAINATTYDAIPLRLHKLISSPSGSAVAQVDIALTGSYSEYLLEVYDFKPANDADHLLARFSTDGGSTYVASADYKYALTQTNVGGNRNNTDAAATSLRVAGSLDNARISKTLSISIYIADGSSTYNTLRVKGLVQDSAAGNAVGLVDMGGDLEVSNTAATHIRLLASTGNITLSAKLYGVVR